MSDLATLLRDAGRPPTTDVDLDAVRARGRRITRNRRLGSAGTAVGLLAGIALAVTSIPDSPPRVDPVAPTSAPTVDSTTGADTTNSEDAAPVVRLPEFDDRPAVEALAWDRAPAVDDPAADEVLAARLGLSTVRLHVLNGQVVATFAGDQLITEDGPWRAGPPEERSGLWNGTLTMPIEPAPAMVDGRAAFAAGLADWEGGMRAQWTDTGASTWSRLTLPGRVSVSGPPGLVFGPNEMGEAVHVEAARDGLVMSVSPGSIDGLDGLVRRVVTGHDVFADPLARVVGSLGSRGVLVLVSAPDGTETLAVFGPVDPRVRRDLLVVEPPATILDVAALGDVAIAVLRTPEGAFDLLVQPLDGADPRRARTPFGRTVDATRVAVQTGWGRFGPVVTLDVEGPDGLSSSIVDGPALVYSDTEDVAIMPTELGGQLHLHAWPGLFYPTDPDAPVGCGEGADVNTDPADRADLVLWYACGDESLFTGGQHPLVAVGGVQERIVPSGLGLRSLLRRSFTLGVADRARGLRSVMPRFDLSPTVEIREVHIEDGAVTVDLVPRDGGHTTLAGAVGDRFVTALAGTVFQFDEFRSLQVTLDGDCDALAELVGAPSCTFTVQDAPWNQ